MTGGNMTTNGSNFSAILLAAVMGIVSDQVFAASYLCIGEQVTGFAMNKNTHVWAARSFQPKRYVIKVPDKSSKAPSGAFTSAMAVYEFGNTDEYQQPMLCKKDFSEAGNLFCSGLGDNFEFNRKSLRFLHSLTHGYVHTSEDSFFGPEGDVTPFIEIGTCSII
jgi:hypothetical protein